MDPHCKESGCYMFAPDTPEREACVKNCRLERGEPKMTKAGLLLAFLAGFGLGEELERGLESQMKTKTAIQLGELALLFGRTNRVTYHEDGKTLESDTDHTVMLGLIATNFCPNDLSRGLVAQFCLVHDLIEAYCGDTNSFDISPDDLEAKKKREAAAYDKLVLTFEADAPWLVHLVRNYEAQEMPEARYVRLMDKAMPKITHALNGCAAIKGMGKTHADLMEAHAKQFKALCKEYPEFADAPVMDMLRTLMLVSETAYQDTSVKVGKRGTTHYPCEECEQTTEGSTRDGRGFNRCNKCGYPGQ